MTADAKQLLYQAKASAIGIVVTVSDVPAAIAQFTLARKELADPDLKQIQVRRAPNNPDGALWLVKMVDNPGAALAAVIEELSNEA